MVTYWVLNTVPDLMQFFKNKVIDAYVKCEKALDDGMLPGKYGEQKKLLERHEIEDQKWG